MDGYAYDYEYQVKKRPHVVILGAGASCAAIHNGDKYGKRISAMNGFIEKLNLESVFRDVFLHTDSDNLEDIYMELDERSKTEADCMTVKKKLETKIFNYMSEFQLPDSPTVYDYLVMSLTAKDLIASFNWDPLLVQAYTRASYYTENLPQIIFLHGNVAVGFCEEDNIIGNTGQLCRCGKPLVPTKLLFPIRNKNYNNDIIISKSWEMLGNTLEVAYMITVFGYSVPKSDVKAVEMLKKAWGSVQDRNLEEIEIIDVRKEREVIESWSDFIHTHHYSYYTNFFDTTLGMCPRRSCEATFDRVMNNYWLLGGRVFKSGMDFQDIDRLTHDLIIDEREKKGTKKILRNPYI